MVYHANYLRYMERGRTEFFRLAGIAAGRLEDDEPTAWTLRKSRDITAPRGWTTCSRCTPVCTAIVGRAHDGAFSRSTRGESCWSKGGSKPASSR